MMVGPTKKFLFTFFGLLIFGVAIFIFAPMVLANHDSTSEGCASAGGKWCATTGGSSSYWCYYGTACPANTETDCTAQSGKWCKNSDGVTGWCATGSNATCPAYDSASCAAQNGKWCASSGGMSSGWCSSDLNYVCPASTETECTAQGSEWCPGTYGGSAWCAGSGGCPINDQATCESKGRSWCVTSGSSYGWCASTGMTCSGSSSGGTTTGSTGSTDGTTSGSTGTTTGSTGSTGGTTTGSTGSTTDPQTTCTQGSGKWCKNSDGTGWCSYSTYPCPAYDTASCSAQGGEWCQNSYGSGGWCAVSPSTCPINDKTTCESKGRQWCLSQYGGSGWCTYSTTEKCPAYTEADCKAQGSEWCPGTYGGSAWCAGSGGCPINDQATCNTKGKYWCTSATYSSSGWCTDYPSTYDQCTKGGTPTTVTPTTVPTAPENLTATVIDIDDVRLTWTDKSDNETKFELWKRKSGGPWVMEGTTPSGVTTFEDMYLEVGTNSYEYFVKACNALGCSADSNWVKATATGKGSVTPTPEPTTGNTESECRGAGNKWCKNFDGSGWCSTDKTNPCPAYTETDCKAASGKWCKNSDGATGWCSYGTYACPAYDKATCEAQKGEWCTSTYTNYNGNGSTSLNSSSWCTTSGSGCPINDEATCKEKGRKWCTSVYGTSWCTYSTTEKCPTETEPVPTPVPVPIYGWPQSQGECVDYGGVWCTSSYSGTKTGGMCNMSGSVCPPVVPAGKYMCSDWFITTQANLCAPAVTNKEGCQFKGGAWCENDNKTFASTADSSGWCEYSKVCPKYPPTGKMTCPDNKTFVTTLTDCPRKSVVKPPEPEKTICVDGTVVIKGEKCPIVMCPDGTKVESGTTCPIVKQDQQILCSKKGGVWCVDTALRGRDYCSLVNTCVFIDQPVEPPEDILTPKEIKKVERQKSLLKVRLSSLEKGFIRLKDEDSLAKITELKDKLNNLIMDQGVFATLQEIQEDADLMREIYRDSLENKKGERDQKLEKLALAKIKKQMTRFTIQIKTLSVRLTRFEKQGINVPAEIKETILHLNELFTLIKESDDYDTVRLAAEEVGNLSQDLNAMLPVLEQLVRMPKVFKSVAAQITRDERSLKQAANVARVNKLDFSEVLEATKNLIAEAKEALAQAKKGEYGNEDPADFVRAAILDKLEEAEDHIQNIQGFANIRRHVGQIGASINRSAAQIKRLIAKKQDVAEAQALLADIQEKYKQLKTVTDKKLNINDVDNVLNALDELVDLVEKLEKMVGLVKPTVSEQDLIQPLKGNNAVTPLNIPELEDTLSRSLEIKNFFVRLPETGAVLVNFRR